MNTSIHLPEELALRLEAYITSAKGEVKSKNAFIVQAVQQLLDEVESKDNWCAEIMSWQGGDLAIEREELTGFDRDLGL